MFYKEKPLTKFKYTYRCRIRKAMWATCQRFFDNLLTRQCLLLIIINDGITNIPDSRNHCIYMKVEAIYIRNFFVKLILSRTRPSL